MRLQSVMSSTVSVLIVSIYRYYFKVCCKLALELGKSVNLALKQFYFSISY